MAKGPYLTPIIKKLIAEIYVNDPQVKPIKARELVLKKMKAEGLNETYGSNFPGISTVSKELKLYRDNNEARSPRSKGLDVEWTIQSLSKYPIPPDALPSIFNAWFLTQSFKSDIKQIPSMTIRQAQWVARLYTVIKDTKVLLIYSHGMADLERQAEVSGLDYYGSQWDTAEVFSQMTGQQFTQKKMEEITGLSGRYVTRIGLEETTLLKREAQNEREHNTERQE